MSDYLTTLAARSLDLAPVAAPRVVSLFEPAAPTGSVGVPVPLDVDRTSDGPASTTMTAAHVVDPPPPRAFDLPRPLLPVAPSSPPAIRPPEQAPSEWLQVPLVRARSEQPVSIRPSPVVADRSAPATKQPTRTRDAATSAGPLVIREVRRESPAEAPVRRSAPRLDEVLRRLTDGRLTALERGIARRNDGDPPTTQHDMHVPALRIPPLHEAAAVRPATAFREAQVGDTAPTVHVTIGRIEVRAVTPPAAAPRPQPAAVPPHGTTPLDDYLKHRSGGGR